MPINEPVIEGHKGAILDLDWCPFNDNLIASASEDSTICIWKIPDEGLTQSISKAQVKLKGHERKVIIVTWHAYASDILLSTGSDHKILIWNVQTKVILTTIYSQSEIQSACWSFAKDLICVTSKDKMIRIFNPKTGHLVNVS